MSFPGNLRSRVSVLAALLIVAATVPSAVAIEPPWRCLTNWFRESQSFPAAAIREGKGLITSPWRLFRFKTSGGQAYSELSDFLPKPKPPPLEVKPEEASGVLAKIDADLVADGFPELKLQNARNFEKWLALREQVLRKLPEGNGGLSDYVAFLNGRQRLFMRQGNSLIPIELVPGAEGHGEIRVLSDQAFAVNGTGILEEEFAIRDSLKTQASARPPRLRRMSPVTNDMRYPRDALFDLEGGMMARLRSAGGRTIPRLQILLRSLITDGTSVGADGSVHLLPEVLEPLRDAYWLAFPKSGETFDAEISAYAQRRVYHALADRYLDGHPEEVTKFMKSEEFAALAPDFIDRHLAYIGATEFDVAKGMLAGNMLYGFESRHPGVSSLAQSPSLRALADSPGYSRFVENWMKAHFKDFPADIPSLIAKTGGSAPFPAEVKMNEDLILAVKAAQADVKATIGQLGRHSTHTALSTMVGHLGLRVDPRRSFPNNLIANFAMAKAEGIYTVSAFFDPTRADGYLGPAIPGYKTLPRFETAPSVPSAESVSSAFKDILSARTFEEQTAKIVRHAPLLSSFMMNDPSVSPNVRQFARTLYSDQFAVQVYKGLGKAYDPNVMNRFFPDGYKDFENMNRYRYLFDMVHGVTTAMLQVQGSKRQYLERVLGGTWKPYDFSHAPPESLGQALKISLGAAQTRLAKLQGQPVPANTIVDVRETVEYWIGWDTYDMKFQRWKDHWDEWSPMGAGWNCICFTRKTLFNPFTVRQF